MAGFAPLWNQNGLSRVILADTFCKETASCLTNIAHPKVMCLSPNPATSALSSAVLSSRWLCCFGSSLATERPRRRTTTARPTLSQLKLPLRLIQWPQLRLTPLHQPRLTPSLRLLPIRSLPRPLIQSRLRPLTRHLPRLRQPLLTRNTAGLRASIDNLILGGHRAVSALFSYPQMAPAAAVKLPTGMTLC